MIEAMLMMLVQAAPAAMPGRGGAIAPMPTASFDRLGTSLAEVRRRVAGLRTRVGTTGVGAASLRATLDEVDLAASTANDRALRLRVMRPDDPGRGRDSDALEAAMTRLGAAADRLEEALDRFGTSPDEQDVSSIGSDERRQEARTALVVALRAAFGAVPHDGTRSYYRAGRP